MRYGGPLDYNSAIRLGSSSGKWIDGRGRAAMFRRVQKASCCAASTWAYAQLYSCFDYPISIRCGSCISSEFGGIWVTASAYPRCLVSSEAQDGGQFGHVIVFRNFTPPMLPPQRHVDVRRMRGWLSTRRFDRWSFRDPMPRGAIFGRGAVSVHYVRRNSREKANFSIRFADTPNPTVVAYRQVTLINSTY